MLILGWHRLNLPALWPTFVRPVSLKLRTSPALATSEHSGQRLVPRRVFSSPMYCAMQCLKVHMWDGVCSQFSIACDVVISILVLSRSWCQDPDNIVEGPLRAVSSTNFYLFWTGCVLLGLTPLTNILDILGCSILRAKRGPCASPYFKIDSLLEFVALFI